MRCRLVPIALALLLAATSSRATVIAPLDLPELVLLADRVVVGRVGTASSSWDDDGRHVVTDTELAVEEVLKGRPIQRVHVRTAGGVVGELGQQVSGAARLRTGERVLLFLQDEGGAPPAEARCRVVGLARGLFMLRPAHDGRELASQDLTGLEVLDPTSGRVRVAAPLVLDAAQLRQRIRALVDTPSSIRP